MQPATLNKRKAIIFKNILKILYILNKIRIFAQNNETNIVKQP